jgi:hypothetical protein
VIAPASETRASRLKSGFLKTLIFTMSPGTSKYGDSANTGIATKPASKIRHATQTRCRDREPLALRGFVTIVTRIWVLIFELNMGGPAQT